MFFNKKTIPILKSLYAMACICLLMCSCMSPSAAQRKRKKSSYHEDLSQYRPHSAHSKEEKNDAEALISKEKAPDQHAGSSMSDLSIAEDLESYMQGIAAKNRELGYVKGYTIQVYSGVSREKADRIKSTIYKVMPESRPKMLWDSPNYKVKVGRFFQKTEAQTLYAKLKKVFPQSLIVPIKIKNS